MNVAEYWLKNGCNYDKGVKMYAQYGQNAFLKKIFEKGWSVQFDVAERLKAEIALLAKKDFLPTINGEKVEAKQIVSKNKKQKQSYFESILAENRKLDKPVQEARNRISEYFQVRTKNSNVLAKYQPKKSEAIRLIDNNIFLTKMMTAEYKKIQHFIKTGNDAIFYEKKIDKNADAISKVNDEQKLLQLRRNAHTRKSKLNKALKKEKNKAQIQYLNTKIEYEVLILNEIKTQLKVVRNKRK